MKPLKERLPLIDAAIEYHKGKWPLLDSEGLLYFSDARSKTTRDEFKQRAKELGYINGYKYGVEYETNGEKPDLPDDAEVVTAKGTHRFVNWTVGDFNWDDVEKFRIVDDRFKPKEQDMCECNLSECPRPIKMEQDMNDWYEKGELPPVGSFVEYHVNGSRWDECEVLATDEDALWLKRSNGRLVTRLKYIRPLRTETDELAEQILNDIDKGMCWHKDIAEHLIEQGYRKIKPMSEDEFVAECLSLMALKNYDHKAQIALCEAARFIHKAGCRFLAGDSNE